MTLRDSTHLLRKLNPHCAIALAADESLAIDFIDRFDKPCPAYVPASDPVASAT
ncbi:hypothetical protein P0D69_03705 [Paraburkholderia sediminicola]|uniref:hypothetical protein n=1 Tax=Paraburkholderia sediminicola TaxID=458836 RepID=UPI0038BE0C55